MLTPWSIITGDNVRKFNILKHRIGNSVIVVERLNQGNLPVTGSVGKVACAGLDKRPDNVRVSVGTGQVQGCVPVGILMVGVDATRQDGFHVFHLAIPADCRVPSRVIEQTSGT